MRTLMEAVIVESEDLHHLARLVPDLCFGDAERQAALLENGSRDFNAVPGSGKTSLLAAKLLLLAQKWPYAHKGICILSHTNIAHEEITRRLVNSADGSRLMAYPHFIGTIHGFINQFLAMAALRRKGIKVDMIDDEVFAKKAWSLTTGNRYRTLRAWLDNQPNAERLITELFYKDATLDVVSEGGRLPGANTASFTQIVALKKELAGKGVFRYRDMFAYAQLTLADYPHLLDVVHRRFPMVFIDEMQDTAWEQEEVLNRLFDNKSVVQRFGDVDQKIISGDPDAGKVTFPRTGHGTISTSKRFGKIIAEAVTSVRVSQLPVIGEADDLHSPVLLLYKTANIRRVPYQFGELVVDRLSQAELKKGLVRGMCTRRSGEGKVDLGRHMEDYWPAFGQEQRSFTKDDLQFFFQHRPTPSQASTLAQRVAEVRRGVLLALRAAKAPVAAGLRDDRSLLRAVKEQGGDIKELQQLIRELTLNATSYIFPDDKVALASIMYIHLANLLPIGLTADQFAALKLFESPLLKEKERAEQELPTVCTVARSDRVLEYRLGTVASMKGETHIASLVLESYGGPSRRFDLQMALPFLAGIGNDFSKLTDTQKVQMRNLYVAMSRPTHFLCMAANESRVEQKTISALAEKGWEILHAV